MFLFTLFIKADEPDNSRFFAPFSVDSIPPMALGRQGSVLAALVLDCQTQLKSKLQTQRSWSTLDRVPYGKPLARRRLRWQVPASWVQQQVDGSFPQILHKTASGEDLTVLCGGFSTDATPQFSQCPDYLQYRLVSPI